MDSHFTYLFNLVAISTTPTVSKQAEFSFSPKFYTFIQVYETETFLSDFIIIFIHLSEHNSAFSLEVPSCPNIYESCNPSLTYGN